MQPTSQRDTLSSHLATIMTSAASILLAGGITATVSMAYLLSKQVEVNTLAIESLSRTTNIALEKQELRISKLELQLNTVTVQLARHEEKIAK